MKTTSQAARSERLLRAANNVRAIVEPDPTTVSIDGEDFTAWTILCRDNHHAIQLINEMAQLDADEDAELRAIAHGFLTDSFGRPCSVEAICRRLHDYVSETIDFVPEAEEAFRSAALTLMLAQGDCDDTSHLLASLAKACGIAARVVGVPDPHGEISHVCAQLYVPGLGWTWAECTFPCPFGEEPRTAAKRMGILREDLT